MVNLADLSGYYCVIHLCPYVNEHLCCVWLTPVTPLRDGTVQSSPRGRRGVCEQPPCPQSPCHITIRCCSRTANYACVWQPHCQGGENKTAGKWRMKRGRVNSVSLCGCVTVRVSREEDFVVILIWFHYGGESECLQTCLILMWQTE